MKGLRCVAEEDMLSIDAEASAIESDLEELADEGSRIS